MSESSQGQIRVMSGSSQGHVPIRSVNSSDAIVCVSNKEFLLTKHTKHLKLCYKHVILDPIPKK